MLSFGLFVILLMLTKRNVADIEKKNATDQCTPGQFPSHVCILYLKNEQLCGGTIIHPRHVLTSSYCFRDSLERRNLTKKVFLCLNLVLNVFGAIWLWFSVCSCWWCNLGSRQNTIQSNSQYNPFDSASWLLQGWIWFGWHCRFKSL